MTRPLGWILLAALGFASTACGGDKSSDDDDAGRSGSGATGASAGAGGSTGGASGAGTGGAGGSTGGVTAGGAGGSTGGSANAGSGGSTGGAAGSAGVVDCTGTFGAPELLFAAATGETPQSLSVTGDDLELFYEVESDAAGPRLEVRKRSSRTAPFGEPEALNLDFLSFCSGENGPSLDVSDDGLRLYLTCVDTSDDPIVPGPIRVAERTSRTSSAFRLRPDSVGLGSVSISVSADELTAFWSDYADKSAPKPVTATRPGLQDSFGAPLPLAGAEDDTLRHPEISSDLRYLFGALDLGTGFSRLVMYTRPSPGVSFGAPGSQGLPTPPLVADDPGTATVEGVEDLSPTLSADCRSLYFLRYTHAEARRFDVYGARR
jgi:hypothetical protein